MKISYITTPITLGLTLLGGFTAGLFFSSQVVSDQPQHRFCDAGVKYMSRRLGSDQTDNLCETYQGQVLLIVNTASRCAFTGQYEALEKIYGEYRDRGFTVIGFPSNDFANQEPGSEREIKNFCRLTYGVQFPMYAKSVVTGEKANPVFKQLALMAGNPPRWNFHKYLIDREGRLVDDYSSFTSPDSKSLTRAIESVL